MKKGFSRKRVKETLSGVTSQIKEYGRELWGVFRSSTPGRLGNTADEKVVQRLLSPSKKYYPVLCVSIEIACSVFNGNNNSAWLPYNLNGAGQPNSFRFNGIPNGALTPLPLPAQATSYCPTTRAPNDIYRLPHSFIPLALI